MQIIRLWARIATSGLALFIIFVTLSPIGLRPETGLPAPVERFGAFFALSLCATIGWPRRRLTALIIVVLCALALEAMQNLTATRHGRILDALEKALGAGAGLLAAETLEYVARRLLPLSGRSKMMSGRHSAPKPRE